MSKLRIWVLLFLAFTTTNCVQRSSSANGGKSAKIKAIRQDLKGCTVQVPPSLENIFNSNQDKFFTKLILEEIPGGCQNTFDPNNSDVHIENLAKMIKSKGCTDEGRAFISEDGNYKKNHASRFIDVYQCGSTEEDRIWVTDSRQVLVFDPASGGFNFYTSTSSTNNFLFHGNSFQMADAAESQGFFNHPCTNCHVSGSILMKELRFPWLNWQTPVGIPVTQAFSQLKDIDKLLAEAKQQVPGKGLFIAENVEIAAIKSQTLTNIKRISNMLNNVPMSFPPNTPPAPIKLKDLLKPLFCETEVVMSTAEEPLPSDGSVNGNIRMPIDLFINRILIPERGPKLNLTGVANGGDSRLDMTGFADTEDERPRLSPSLAQASGTGGQWRVPTMPIKTWVDFKQKKGIEVPGAAGEDSPASVRTGRFPLLHPSRSFVDDDFLTRAIAKGLLEEKLVADVLMIDFSNPTFSNQRCGLLQNLADVEIGSIGSGKSLAAGITKSVDDALGAVTNEGTTAYQKNKKASLDDHAKRIMAYHDACLDASNTKRIANDP